MSVRSLNRLRQLAGRETSRPAAERMLDAGGSPAVGGGGWWGEITSCNYSAGTVGVKPAAGTLPSLSVDEEAEEVTAWQGLYGWHVLGDSVFVVSSGPGVTPKWTVMPRPGGLRHYESISGGTPPTAVTGCES